MSHDDDEVNPFSREHTARQQNAPQPEQPVPLRPIQPRQRSGLAWMIPLIFGGVGLIIICCGGLVVWVAWTGIDYLAAPVSAVVEELGEDQRIVEKLGKPLKKQSGLTSKLEVNNGNGSATIDCNIKGPKGTAHVTGTMQSIAGTWSAKDIQVTCSDGTQFKVPPQKPDVQ